MDQLKYRFSSLSESIFIIFFPLLLLPLVYTLFLKLKSRRSNLPPSPPKLPIIGNLHQIGKLLHRSLRALSDKYGPLMFLQFGSFPILVVSSAQVVEEIVKKYDTIFSNRPNLGAASDFMYGGHDVIFSPYGEFWRQAKKICLIQLLSQKMVRELQSLREQEISEMLKHIELSRLEGSPANFDQLFYTLGLNMICRSAVGDEPEGKVYVKLYQELVEQAQKLAESFCFGDLFPWLGWVDILTGYRVRLKNLFKKLDKFMDRIIDEHATRIIDEKDGGGKGFVSILLHLQREGKLDIKLEQIDIKGIIQSIFSGATDTLPSHLIWIMADLVKNPRVMQKAQEEVRRMVGEKGKINETDIDQMHYLKCVFQETVRLHGFGLFFRETSKQVNLCGYEIPAKTRVMINNWAVQRDPRVWDKPDEFIPERFEDAQIDFRGLNTRYIPFGFGRRICPGSTYAFALAENVIANLLYWYDWELPGGDKPENLDMTEKFAIAIYKKDPLQLVPIPRFPNNQH